MTSLDELGPVDYLIVEFPAGRRTSPARWPTSCFALVDAGTIRVIDVLILTKNEDGSVDATSSPTSPSSASSQSSRPSWPSCSPPTTSSTSQPRWTRAASPAS